MDKKVGFVCAFCGSLAFIAAILAFAAEGTRLKAKDIKITEGGKYIYPSNPAARFGFLSLLFFMISHIITNVATGCFSCKSYRIKNTKTRCIALACFLISWVLFVFLFFMLLSASTLSDPNAYEGHERHYYVKPGYFAEAGVLVLATIALGLIPYVIQSKSENNGLQQQNQGILMGQPKFPPQNYPQGYIGQPQFPPQNYPQNYMGQPQHPPQNYPPGYLGQSQFTPQHNQPQPNKGFAPNNKGNKGNKVFFHEDTHQRQQNP